MSRSEVRHPKRCRGGSSMNATNGLQQADSSPAEVPATPDHGSSPAIHRVAILGTGKMGSALAARLSEAGFELTLWNRTPSRAEALGLGPVAESPAAAARGADLVISSLTGPDAVRAVYLGRDGALSSGAGARFVEMSTAGADIVPDLGAQVRAAGG